MKMRSNHNNRNVVAYQHTHLHTHKPFNERTRGLVAVVVVVVAGRRHLVIAWHGAHRILEAGEKYNERRKSDDTLETTSAKSSYCMCFVHYLSMAERTVVAHTPTHEPYLIARPSLL